ncbi:MAG: hypothetical protein AAFQ82_28535, partial [Myxococcota bacterium]
ALAAPSVGDAYVRAFFRDRRRESGRVPEFFLEDGFDRSDSRARGSVGAVGLGLLPPGGFPDELDVLRSLAGDPSTPDDDIPIAVVVGKQDAFVNPAYLEALKTGGVLPTLWFDTIIEVRGAGHATQFDSPFVFNWLVQAFAHDVSH